MISTSTLAPNFVRELRSQRLERPAQDGPDVGERQRRRVQVLLEDGLVDVADPGLEQALKDTAADDPGDHALDHRPGRDQVRLGVEHEVVGDQGRDLVLDRVVVERGPGALGELVGVEDRDRRVADDHGSEQDDRREHGEDRR